jgi:hypothetical protein
MDANELVANLGSAVAREPSAELWAYVNSRRYEPLSGRMIFWTYQCSEGPRVEMYARMVDHWCSQAIKHHPDCPVLVCHGDVVSMLLRAYAMCAFVHGPAFTAPVVFMDNDAFPNASLLPALDLFEHVGLTHRSGENLMPVNEGVIFAKPSDETRAFFRAYVATFENIISSVQITATEKNSSFRRAGVDTTSWMGGQIALNLLSSEPCVSLLPCADWNYGMSSQQHYTAEDMDKHAVLHIKGTKKVLFDQIKTYQESRQ